LFCRNKVAGSRDCIDDSFVTIFIAFSNYDGFAIEIDHCFGYTRYPSQGGIDRIDARSSSGHAFNAESDLIHIKRRGLGCVICGFDGGASSASRFFLAATGTDSDCE